MTLLLVLPFTGYAQQVRGDVNGSGDVDIDDINDINAVINTMLHKVDPTAGTDVDDNGAVDIDDLNIIINVIVGKDGSGSHGQGDWVDLGLPSGTLWATRNIGAASPEDYGDHFAWGEITPKSEYSWETYKWFNEYYDTEGSFHYGLTKYCTHFTGGLDDFVDIVFAVSTSHDTILPVGIGVCRVHALGIDIQFVFLIAFQPAVIFESVEVFHHLKIHFGRVLIGANGQVNLSLGDVQQAVWIAFGFLAGFFGVQHVVGT